MRTSVAFPAFVVACAMTMWSCSGGTIPSSPSVVNPLSAPGAAAAGCGPSTILRRRCPILLPRRPRRWRSSSTSSALTGRLPSCPIRQWRTWAIRSCSPTTDRVLHHIVLDDGTDLGDVAPGQSSAPMPLTTPTATFHCTIHPSMVGAINVDIILPPIPEPTRRR